jgi:transposase
MLNLATNTRVFLAIEPTDMRKGFNGLFALVESAIRQDPFSGHLFVFRNRRRDRLKIMWWDRDGLAIWYKRLEKGSFQFPTDVVPSGARASRDGKPPARCEMRAEEFAMLLGGIDLAGIRRRKRYERQSA